MHFSGSKKEKRYGMTAGGKKVVELMKKALPKDEVVEVKIYSLCSEGNRNIIQASKNKKDITKAMDDLNKLATKYDGFNRTKFYLLEQ